VRIGAPERVLNWSKTGLNREPRGGTFSRLTSAPGFEDVATWPPDGRVAYIMRACRL
jgi:hypothetical protein